MCQLVSTDSLILNVGDFNLHTDDATNKPATKFISLIDYFNFIVSGPTTRTFLDLGMNIVSLF